ncbi:AAA family ATPase [Treponema sp.]|uniref:AAA family ATPase n=1 Tax=Treponema sp. TaxID=166 RepID=UPI0025FFC0E8|nr:ATP-binding protein [Treponema sp.]MBR4322373.1 ATP-binding protein [Treponema sp.]
MKLKKITINKLFGLEYNNFEIDLYPAEKLTLLYGFNGLGKTTIIKLVSAIISCDLVKLLELHFESASLTFEDNSKLCVNRDLNFEDSNIRILFWKSLKEQKDYYHPISFIEITENTETLYNFRIAGAEKHIIYEYANPQYLDDNSLVKLEELQKKLLAKVDLHIIFGNRDFNRTTSPEAFKDRVKFNKEDLNKKEIRCNYQEAIDIIAILSAQLLSAQLKEIKDEHSTDTPIYFYAQIPDKLEELEEELFDINNRNKLTSEKIRLFEDIINKKLGLIYKNVRFTDTSLIVENVYSNDRQLELKMLSSGEKNILCLFLEIIFTGQSNSIFFIDEPETSLHIEWQSNLVNCLLEICNKYDYQVIITTHSPEIVGEYDGLTTEIRSERFKYGTRFFS